MVGFGGELMCFPDSFPGIATRAPFACSPSLRERVTSGSVEQLFGKTHHECVGGCFAMDGILKPQKLLPSDYFHFTYNLLLVNGTRVEWVIAFFIETISRLHISPHRITRLLGAVVCEQFTCASSFIYLLPSLPDTIIGWERFWPLR